MRVQGSHGLLSSIFFVSFLLSGCCDGGFFCCTSHLTAWGPSSTVVLVLESPFASENQIFFVGPTLSWTNAVGDANAYFVVRNTYNGTDFANELSLLLPTWNTTANNNRTVTNNNGTFCANKALSSSFWRWNFKIKRRKRPCAYYSNSTATFHCLLVGDLVFKLNPGPENNDNLSTLCSHGIRKTPPSMRSRNPSNLTVVNRLPLVKNVKRPLSFCLMNARSVRNKSADIFDFVCEYKIDLLAITETWLNANDDAVTNELCPTNYKLYDHPRTDRVGGGTALLYREEDKCWCEGIF